MPFDKLLCKVCAKHFHTVPDRKKNIQDSTRRTHCVTTVVYNAQTSAAFATSRYTFICVKGHFLDVLSV